MYEGVGSWTEKSSLLSRFERNESPYHSISDSDAWSATPIIRNQWIKKSDSIATLVLEKAQNLRLSLPPVERNMTNNFAHANRLREKKRYGFKYEEWGIVPTIYGAPGVIIASFLILFFSSFGLAMFPSEWEFPVEVPRAVGVQMFLFSSIICQIVLTTLSDFPAPFGMMMVENIPFMQVISRLAVKIQGPGIDTFATVLVIFALSSVVVGLFFYLLGKYKLGNSVSYFPKHIIIGCIAGIGVFIWQTGMEVSTNVPWEWNTSIISKYTVPHTATLWLTAFGFELLLRLLMYIFKTISIIPPFYFIAIPPTFYMILLILGVPISVAHDNGWFFDKGPSIQKPLLMWQLMDFTKVNWTVVGESIPTILALTIFSLMHVPINIPSLAMSTQQTNINMNNELIAHGWANFISGILGGLQNYLCYSNSLLYYKCNGRGKISGYILAAITSVFFYFGPTIVYYIPRCMAGCLLLHVGIDLMKEGIWDSIHGLDTFEYISVLSITLVMTFYGLTAGLVFGVVCAAITFTIQISRQVSPIRCIMRATTLRSSRWRAKEAQTFLDMESRRILVVQLQGQIFFGNASQLSYELEDYLKKTQGYTSNHSSDNLTTIANSDDYISHIILDFTLVLTIDSSAAEIIANIYDVCEKYNIKLCYSKTHEHGFPDAVGLVKRLETLSIKKLSATMLTSPSESLKITKTYGSNNDKSPYSPGVNDTNSVYGNTSMKGSSHDSQDNIDHKITFNDTVDSMNTPPNQSYKEDNNIHVCSTDIQYENIHLADNLDEALAWCEDSLITQNIFLVPPGQSSSPTDNFKDKPQYLRQMYSLLPPDVPRQIVDKLFSYFKLKRIAKQTILWRQGEESKSAVVLVSGGLINQLEEEKGTTEKISIGHLVGEYGLITAHRRFGTLIATEDSVVYEITIEAYENMTREDPALTLLLAKICMVRKIIYTYNIIRYNVVTLK